MIGIRCWCFYYFLIIFTQLKEYEAKLKYIQDTVVHDGSRIIYGSAAGAGSSPFNVYRRARLNEENRWKRIGTKEKKKRREEKRREEKREYPRCSPICHTVYDASWVGSSDIDLSQPEPEPEPHRTLTLSFSLSLSLSPSTSSSFHSYVPRPTTRVDEHDQKKQQEEAFVAKRQAIEQEENAKLEKNRAKRAKKKEKEKEKRKRVKEGMNGANNNNNNDNNTNTNTKNKNDDDDDDRGDGGHGRGKRDQEWTKKKEEKQGGSEASRPVTKKARVEDFMPVADLD